ncbi:sensor histidine kinase [Flavobacterium pedocola]
MSNYKYHLFNLIGWLLYELSTLTLDKITYGLARVEKWDSETTNALYYIITEGVLCALLGFVLSYILLFYIDYKVDLANAKRKTWVNLILVFLATQLLYHTFLWPMLDIPSMYYYGSSSSTELNLYMKLANFPPFAVAFLVWLFVVLSIKVYAYINEVKITKLALESNLKESQLNSLKGQINPHFMFNSLNNIRGLILENPVKSREMITRLSEMLRYSLTKNDINTIALEEELEMVENFIEISKIQLEDRLTFVSSAAPSTLKIKIPPMIIQMLVENAVKHGIATLKEGGRIQLATTIEKEQLQILVSNTGKLAIAEDSTQIGLKNIQNRLSLLYGEQSLFELTEHNNEVLAKILIPIP